MIAANAVDQAALKAGPERGLRIAVAQRRGHHITGGIRPGIQGVIEDQIMRAGLRDGGDTIGTSLVHQVHGQRRGQVDEIHRATGNAAEEEAPTHGLGLGSARASGSVVLQ